MRFSASIALLLASFATTASGAVRVYEGPARHHHLKISSSYVINAELGRAWVELAFAHASPEEPTEVLRVSVRGLKFDAASSSIVYQSDGKNVECAKVLRQRNIPFTGASIKPTGRCKITYKDVREPVDDGFNVAKKPRFVVYFATTA